jgi:hypothetical protein
MIYKHEYSSNKKIFSFDQNFNEEFSIGLIPSETIKLEIVDQYNVSHGIKSKFNKPIGCANCNHDLCPKNLPSSITHITFGWNFNQPVNFLHEGITHLFFGANFNQQVDNLPSTVTHLSLGFCFAHSVDSLPQNLTNLTLSYVFNLPVNSLPKSLININFCDYFSQSIDNLPDSVKFLSLGSKFNQQVNKYPESLEELSFMSSSSIKNQIPQTIKIINIYWDYCSTDSIISNVPSNIQKIRINDTNKINLITKIPFGCVITDLLDNIIQQKY